VHVDLLAQPPLTPKGVRRDIVGEEDGLRSALGGSLQRFPHDIAPPDDKTRTEATQGAVEVVERRDEELGSPLGTGEELGVEHEEREDAFRLAGGADEGRVVVDAKIARKQGDRAAH